MRGRISGAALAGRLRRAPVEPQTPASCGPVRECLAVCGRCTFGAINFGLEGSFARITQSPCERPACRVGHGGATKLSRDGTPGRRCLTSEGWETNAIDPTLRG